MRWTFKKNKEDNNTIEIGYSHEQNENCDGIIVYNKKTDKFFLKKIAKDDIYGRERAFYFIRSLMLNNELTTEKRIICTG